MQSIHVTNRFPLQWQQAILYALSVLKSPRREVLDKLNLCNGREVLFCAYAVVP